MQSADGFSQHITQRITCLVEASPTSAIPQLRLLGPAKACGAVIDLLTDRDEDIVPRDELDLAGASMLLVHRTVQKQYARYRQLAQSAVRQGIPIVYDVDDLLLKMADEHPHRRFFEGAVVSTLEATLHADVVTVTSEPLKRILNAFHPHIEVIPNRLPVNVWDVLRSARRPAPDNDRRPVRIGYIGTRSHERDLQAITPALQSVLIEHPEAAFVCYGVQPPPELAGLRNTTYVEPSRAARDDYLVYAEEASRLRLDIGIAPLIDSEFNRCKSQIKLLEYGALGAAGVYSRVAPYTSSVDDGVTGLLVNTPADWRSGLERLIRQPELRRAISEEAFRQVQEQWLLPAGIGQWRSAWQRAAEVAKAGPRPFELPPASDLIVMMRHAMAHQQRHEKPHRLKRRIKDIKARVRRIFAWKPRRAA